MRLGIGSYTYPWAVGVPSYEKQPVSMGIFDLMERAIQMAVPVVQICENLPLRNLLPGELNTLTRLAADNHIALEVGTRGIESDNLYVHLRLAARLGSPLLRVVIDTPGDEPDVSDVINRLRPLIPDFYATGVRLGIENHDRFTAADLVQVVERLGTHAVGIVLDTANSLAALEVPDVTAATLSPYTICFHVKDFMVRRTHRSGLGFVVEGCPAGEGRVDFPALLSRLPRRDPSISVILEQWTPFNGSIPDTVTTEAEWAEQSLTYLRSLPEILVKESSAGHEK